MKILLTILSTVVTAYVSCAHYAHAETALTFTTLAGMAGTTGAANVSPARFSEPFGVAVDSSGNVFVADTNNNAIRKISAAGVVTTLAGGRGMGSWDGTGSAAKFAEPHAIALDSSGNVYVSDFMNNTIRKISPSGLASEVTTVAGSGAIGSANGVGTAATFYNPKDVAVDASGNLYVADMANHIVRKGSAQASGAGVTNRGTLLFPLLSEHGQLPGHQRTTAGPRFSGQLHRSSRMPIASWIM